MWAHYLEKQDIGIGGIGSEVKISETPVADSIEKMERLDKIALRTKENIFEDAEHFEIGDHTYYVLSLESGERIAACARKNSCHYDAPGKYWYSPVGIWTSWHLDVEEKAQLSQQNVALSTMDYYADMVGNHGTVMTNAQFSRKVEYAVDLLARDWGISDYQELVDTVEYMSCGPGFSNCASQSARAWQLCRCTSLLAMAYLADWTTREESMCRSCEVCKIMQRTFNSWDELCQGFLEHYALFSLGDHDVVNQGAQDDVQRHVDIYWELEAQKHSPYRLSWNLNLNIKK